MKSRIILSIATILQLLLISNNNFLWSNPIIVHKGYNYIKVEFHNETSHSIKELKILLDIENSTVGIQMKPMQIYLSEFNPVNEITFPIIVHGIQIGQDVHARFIVSDDLCRVWNFQLAFKIEEENPYKSDLKPNFPNPFSSETSINYVNAISGRVYLKIFNANGQLIKTLIDKYQFPGSYLVNWNGKDENGQFVKSGIYFYQLKTDKCNISRSMLLIK